METNARFGPYEIIEQIGHGGMGLVYRARDGRLHRDVALKVVAETAIEPGTPGPTSHERFLREARASSALNHPNICTIYDVGEQDGQPYLVMELLQGDTLKRIIHGHSLPLDQLLDYGIQLCCALAEAHGRGILHRDIKPANLFITRREQGYGILKVLDFGIAKHSIAGASTTDSLGTFSQLSGNTLSGQGSALGTVSYMAPEQARGEPVDARADIFSAGVVLYEMATGSTPFFGASIAEIFASLLTREPDSIRAREPQFPRELERVIFKALAKDKDKRYASAAGLQADLEQVRAGLLGNTGVRVPTATHRLSGSYVIPSRRRTAWVPIAIIAAVLVLAVIGYAAFNRWQSRPLPKAAHADPIVVSEFTSHTGDTEFDAALRQELSTQLQQSPLLEVVGDTHLRDSLAYLEKPAEEKITPAIAREIAEREGDKAVVNATVSSIGGDYLITLEAQNAVTGDVLARESAQAGSKSKALSAMRAASTRLAATLGPALAAIPRPDLPFRLPPTTPSLAAFRAYLTAEREQKQAAFAQSIGAYKRAIELDPNFAIAYARMGAAYVAIGNPTEGNKAIGKAFDLSAKASDRERLYIRIQYNLDVTGDLPQAIDALKLFAQSYPDEAVAPTDLSVAYLTLGQYEEAYEQVKKTLALKPDGASGYVNALLALTALNRFDEARTVFDKARAQGLADDASVRGTWIFTAYLTGDKAGVRQQMDWARDRTDGFLLDSQMALLDEHEGRVNKAAADWQRAIDQLNLQKMSSATAVLIAQRTLDAALAGRCEGATAALDQALKLDQDRAMQGSAAIAYALCKEPAAALAIAQSLARLYPQDTLINHVYRPDINAAIELGANRPQFALDALAPAEDYDTLGIGSYLRGLAHLALKDGAAAANDFNVPLAHRSIFVLSQQPGMNVAYPLSMLGLARAEALQRDKAKARAQYQAFFDYWKEADPDLPPLLFAKTEAAALGQ
jgi:Flp pilus assembly protein TadD